MKKYVITAMEITESDVVVMANSKEEAVIMAKELVERGMINCDNAFRHEYEYHEEYYKEMNPELFDEWHPEDFKGLQCFYFTFGSYEKYPYQDGYVMVIATSKQKACEIFRKRYPDITDGVLNCAFVYTSDEFYATGMNKSQECHEILSSNPIE